MIYKLFKYDNMNFDGLITCAACSNKSLIGIDSDGTKKYYCSIVDGFVKNGIVYDTTDASTCVKNALYIKK